MIEVINIRTETSKTESRKKEINTRAYSWKEQ
jgi:hypothetical protein